jgi:hypothetical protein
MTFLQLDDYHKFVQRGNLLYPMKRRFNFYLKAVLAGQERRDKITPIIAKKPYVTSGVQS